MMREEEHVFLGFREESENKRGDGGDFFLYTKTALERCEQALHFQSPMLLKGIRELGVAFLW